MDKKQERKDRIELDITKLKCWNCESIGTIKKCFDVIHKEICLTCIDCSASCDYNEVVDALIDISKNKEILKLKSQLAGGTKRTQKETEVYNKDFCGDGK